MIPSSSNSIHFSGKLLDSADVVVIGGGVIGVFSALFMNRLGLKVVLLEKGLIACEQSSRNWGWIRQQGRDEDEIPIMNDALKLWEETERETGGKTGFKRGGLMYLASSEKKLIQRRLWLKTAQHYRINSVELNSKQISSLLKVNQHQWLGAIHTPNDARAEPWQAVKEIALLAQREGVVIIEKCAVRSVETNAGALCGLHTEQGLIKTTQAVLATGAWSSLFLRNLNINIPQLAVRATVAQTAPLPEIWQGNAADEQLSFRRRNDGGYTLALPDFIELFMGPDALRNAMKWRFSAAKSWSDLHLNRQAPAGFPDSWSTVRKWKEDEISPFEKMRILNPSPAPQKTQVMQKRFGLRFPHLCVKEKIPITSAWAGMIDAMPDLVPIVDRAPTLTGLIIATGMSGHGFGIGPGFGKIIAHMAAGKTIEHNMKRFRFSRFSDGSKLKVGPSI